MTMFALSIGKIVFRLYFSLRKSPRLKFWGFFVYIGLLNIIRNIMTTLLQINAQECVDCIQEGLNKNWGAFISCAVTIAVGAIVRHFEKKRIERNNRK